MRKAIIVGSEGQDGRLLCGFLGKHNYQVVGVARDRSRGPEGRLSGVVDILDAGQVRGLVRVFGPDEIYYLAAFHHSSETAPALDECELYRRSHDIHVSGLVNFIEGLRGQKRPARLFYAASSHVFGMGEGFIQDETTPFKPADVYGLTKAEGILACRFYRERHSVFASAGILFNHESPLRDPCFISRKIVRGALEIRDGKRQRLMLGDLDAVVDWGYAPDYVEAMHAVLRHNRADDFVIATGEGRTVREFVEMVFAALGMDWRRHVDCDPALLTKVRRSLIGNPAKIRNETGWSSKTSFVDMVRELVKAEVTLNAASAITR